MECLGGVLMGSQAGQERMGEMGSPAKGEHRDDLVKTEPLESAETGEILESLETMECRDFQEIWGYRERGARLACPEHLDDLVLMVLTARKEPVVSMD